MFTSFRDAMLYIRGVIAGNQKLTFEQGWSAVKIIGDTLGGIFFPDGPAFRAANARVKLSGKKPPSVKKQLEEIDALLALNLEGDAKPVGFKAAKVKGVPEWLLPLLLQMLQKWMTKR